MAARRGVVLLACIAALASLASVAAFVRPSPAGPGRALPLLVARPRPAVLLPSAATSTRPSSLSPLLRSSRAPQNLPSSSLIMRSTESGGGDLVGEDAATFDLKEQSLKVRTCPFVCHVHVNSCISPLCFGYTLPTFLFK